MANLTDTTKFRQINSETLMYNADNVDTLINGLSATYAKSADVYTKDAADSKFATKEDISSVYEFKGSVATFDDLLEISNPKVGDTYNVEDTGKNYAWTGNVSSSAYEQGWDALGGIFDLSNYYTIDEVDAGLSAKVDKVDGMGLSHNDFTDSLATKLNNIAASAQVNVIETVKVDGTALPVTNKAVDITLSGKVDKVAGMGLSHEDFTSAYKNRVNNAFMASGGTISGNVVVKQLDAFAVENNRIDVIDYNNNGVTIDPYRISFRNFDDGTTFLQVTTAGLADGRNNHFNLPDVYGYDNSYTLATTDDVIAETSGKVDKVDGMGLSHNDFTDEAVAKVSGAFQTSGGTVTGITTFNNAVNLSGDLTVSERDSNTHTVISDDRIDIYTIGPNYKETQYRNGDVFFDNGVSESVISIPAKSGTFALTSDIDSAVSGKVDKVDGMGLSHEDFTSAFKAKLTSIASGAEVNQNAFSNVKVGNVTVAATGKTDTVELVAGTNVTLTPDSTNKKITITAASTDISGKADKASFATLANLQKVTPNDFDLDDLVAKYNAMVDILKAIGSALNPSA